MSENLARAAEVLGAPEILVQRSAEARADADGVSVEEVLARLGGRRRLTLAVCFRSGCCACARSGRRS